MPNFYSGNSGDVTCGTTVLKVKSWKATDEIDIHEVTHKGSDGFKEKIYGNRQVSGSVEADWDAEVNDGDPIHIGLMSEAVPGIQLKLDIVEGGKFFDITHAMISKVEISDPVDGVVSYSFDFESSGAYKRPGEA